MEFWTHQINVSQQETQRLTHERGVRLMKFGGKYTLTQQIKKPAQEKKPARTSYSVFKKIQFLCICSGGTNRRIIITHRYMCESPWR